ncbi:Zeta-crystallin [Dactylella cylindrospora]|nr:Zeta-crystallin [Dactylella cylindrospora]
MASLPKTMRSLSQPEPLTASVILTTTPVPQPKTPTEHLIRVHATSPCAGELRWPTFAGPMFGDEIVPCYDLSGTVVSAPEGSPFPAGSEIWGRTAVSHPGNAREYTIAYTEELAHRPRSLDPVTAASVPLSAITAVQALFDQGGIAGFGVPEDERRKVNAGKRILVIAASGGVGVWLLQLAREAGVGGIVGVCGTSNVDLVKSLGATEVIDYKKQNMDAWAAENESKKVDLIIDCKGGQSLTQAWSCITDGGKLLSIVEPPEGRKPSDSKAKDVANYFFIMEPRGSDLLDVGRLFNEGKMQTVVDSVFALEDYQKAFDKLDGGHATGKILIKP